MNYLFKFIVIFIVIKLFYLVVSFWLPKTSTEFLEYENKPYFGHYKVSNTLGLTKNKVRKVVKKEKKRKSLNAKLIAVYVDEKQSVATIEEHRKSYVLKIGDKFKNYELVEIDNNKVVFSKSKKLYEIVMQKSNNLKYKVENVVKESDNTYKIEHETINKYTQNPSLIWKEISIIPSLDNGKMNGFKVKKVKKDSLFWKIGLKKGDVIKSVNNQALVSNKDAFSVYNSISTLEYLQLGVLRNSELIEINYEIR